MSKCPNVQDVRDLRPRILQPGEVVHNTLSVGTAWLRLQAFIKMLARVGLRLVGLTVFFCTCHEMVSLFPVVGRLNSGSGVAVFVPGDC